MEFGLSLGSNLGDRLAHMKEARQRIAGLPDLTVTDHSPIYETDPVDVLPEYSSKKFLNAALIVHTESAPAEFASSLSKIEDDMGRERGKDRNAPRKIDIDIIYAGTEIITEGFLIIPHPRWHSRRFVVQPLADIRPGMLVAGQRHTVLEILDRLPKTPRTSLFAAEW